MPKVKRQLESRAPRTRLAEANGYRVSGRRKAAGKGDKGQAESSLENRETVESHGSQEEKFQKGRKCEITLKFKLVRTKISTRFNTMEVNNDQKEEVQWTRWGISQMAIN